ncbi:MAG: T9SS type A sorting domain-containing protein [Chloroflexota bacterium]|nr:T9SS type A sorting domain-containing protein [Lentimicrobium sp.]
MKTFTRIFFIAALLSTSFILKAQEEKTVTMGASYANEVYYSLQNGVVMTSPRNTWDIAFNTMAFSAGIIINDGAGVELYQYPKASNEGWASFDTTGKAGWTRLINDVSDWENGAFNRLQKGHPDYGWGVYSITTHDVIGDSLFLIKTADGKYRKLDIIKKRSTINQYEIRFADLDGQNEQTLTLDASNYESKVSMSFSFSTGLVDREPNKDSWDLLFTRYLATVQNTPYPVVGVLLNPADTAAEARGVASDFNDWANLDYTTGSDVIGHDWKTFDMGTFTYLMEDSLYYFVKAQNGNIYKISFTSFSGSATGTTTFTQQLVSSLSVPENSSQPTTIYPNPAREQINIVTPAGQKGTVIISNLTGQELSRVSFTNGNSHAINISGLINGTYIVSVKTDNTFYSKKIVIVND